MFLLYWVRQNDLAAKRGASSGLNLGWEASKPFIDRDDPGCRIISDNLPAFSVDSLRLGSLPGVVLVIGMALNQVKT